MNQDVEQLKAIVGQLQVDVEELKRWKNTWNDSGTIEWLNDQALTKRGFAKARMLFRPTILDFPSTLSLASATLTISVPEAKMTDLVLVSGGAVADGRVYTGYVSASGIITIRFDNTSSGTANPISAEFGIILFQAV